MSVAQRRRAGVGAGVGSVGLVGLVDFVSAIGVVGVVDGFFPLLLLRPLVAAAATTAAASAAAALHQLRRLGLRVCVGLFVGCVGVVAAFADAAGAPPRLPPSCLPPSRSVPQLAACARV